MRKAQLMIFHKLIKIVFLFVLIVSSQNLSGSTANESYEVRVDGLACPFCAYGIEKNLINLSEVEAVEVDISTGTIKISVRAGKTLDDSKIRIAIENAGFSYRSIRKLPAKQDPAS